MKGEVFIIILLGFVVTNIHTERVLEEYLRHDHVAPTDECKEPSLQSKSITLAMIGN